MNPNNNSLSITTSPTIIRNQQTTTNYSNQQQLMRLPMNNIDIATKLMPTSSVVSSTTTPPKQQQMFLHSQNEANNNNILLLSQQLKPPNITTETTKVTPTKSKPGRKPSLEKNNKQKINNSSTLIMSPSPSSQQSPLSMSKPCQIVNDYSYNNNNRVLNFPLNQNQLPIMSDSTSPGSENSSNCGFINKNQDVCMLLFLNFKPLNF